MEATKAKKQKHVDLELMEIYVRGKRYPPGMTCKGEKAHFVVYAKTFTSQMVSSRKKKN